MTDTTTLSQALVKLWSVAKAIMPYAAGATAMWVILHYL